MSNKEQAVAEIVAEMENLPDDADWPALSERVRLIAGIEKARADVRAGRVYTTAEIRADLRQWLKK
jgi:predicted transcriptional regulator